MVVDQIVGNGCRRMPTYKEPQQLKPFKYTLIAAENFLQHKPNVAAHGNCLKERKNEHTQKNVARRRSFNCSSNPASKATASNLYIAAMGFERVAYFMFMCRIVCLRVAAAKRGTGSLIFFFSPFVVFCTIAKINHID